MNLELSEALKSAEGPRTVTVTTLPKLRAALQAGGMVVASDVPWRKVRGRWRPHFCSARVRMPAHAAQHEGEGA